MNCPKCKEKMWFSCPANSDSCAWICKCGYIMEDVDHDCRMSTHGYCTICTDIDEHEQYDEEREADEQRQAEMAESANLNNFE